MIGDSVEHKLASSGEVTSQEPAVALATAPSSFEENLLQLLHQIPATTFWSRGRKIASLIPKKQRASAVSEEMQRSRGFDTYLVNLALRIPAASPKDLEAKIRRLVPLRRAGAFPPFERNLLELMRQLPGITARARARRVASLIPKKERSAAIAEERRRSSDFDTYLVNLARRIPAATPRDLEKKIRGLTLGRGSAAIIASCLAQLARDLVRNAIEDRMNNKEQPIPAATSAPQDDRGSVCIVTRKPINNITRGPRMAKALSEAGLRVVVVSTALPVPSLQDMCPEVEYIRTSYQGVSHEAIDRLRQYRDRLQSAKGKAPHRAIVPVGRRLCLIFVAALCTPLLKRDQQTFAQTWRSLVKMDEFEIAIRFVNVLNQRMASHAFARRADDVTANRHFDVVQAYDNYALIAGARLAARTGAKLIYDAVEIATDRVGEDFNILEKLRERAERREEARIFLKADGVVGTGDALAGWYQQKYGMPKPLVVRNCRYYWPYREDGRLRADIDAKPDTRVLVWVGSAYPQQGIELAIQALPHLPSHIHLAVVTDITVMWKRYITEELPACAVSLGVADRVHILPEREPNDLVPYISGGDLGFVLSIPVNHPNQYYNLPNKFFESVMARLPIGTLAFPEVMNLVNKYEIGCVLDEHDPVKNAAVIQEMLEPEIYARLKANVMKAAEVLCWERESQPYIDLVDSLLPAGVRERALTARAEKLRPGGRGDSGNARIGEVVGGDVRG